MLDSATKRRIDTARDILVGKVPDPKSQVEQITIALIYKFMDDMDAQAEEVGGKRKFFAGEFKKYGWANLMSPATSGEERIALYGEGIVKMPQNPGVPKFFRDIFKNAYLPYRDPETLKLFLKEIDGFTYDHSERLGDAFEYLLSVLGSQGDAGQFRTPRHIIDFIVKVVDPKKTDVILDPACGTAGFLISGYKHIVSQNKGKPLTPDEKKRMAANLKGYDISPDMVRLSLVNLYLHGFTAPHVEEYDTLTSQDKWNETADVILANPPFMSPKGGIKPHDRFGVKSKRSEVLFVDYMAEHLTPTGRAGIIVPEGIIFQSQTAYVQLRKMLVENFLIGVISMPSGMFMPYTGVKTSILIFDKQEAKRNPLILFSDVRHIGMSLGVKRTASEHNDLPDVLNDYTVYRQGGEYSRHSWTATRADILANGCNLSGSRYRIGLNAGSTVMVALGEVIAPVERPVTPTPGVPLRQIGVKLWGEGAYEREVIDGGDTKYKTLFRAEADDIIVNKIWARNGSVAVVDEALAGCVGSGEFPMFEPDREKLLPRWIYWLMKTQAFWSRCNELSNGTSGMNRIRPQQFLTLQIPLPPLSVQKEIVAEIEGYQKVIDGARAVLDHYRPHIPIQPDWPMVTIGDLCEDIQYGLSEKLDAEGKGYKCFRMNELVEGVCVDRGDMKKADIDAKEFAKYRLKRGDLLFNRTNSFEHVGRTGVFDLDGDYCFASYLIRLSIKRAETNPFYVNAFMNSAGFQEGIKQFATRAIGQSNINAKSVAAYPIPLPPLPEQERIVSEIEAEQRLVAGNRELIERFETKIQQTLARVWGETKEI